MFGFNSLTPQQFILAIESIGFLPSKFVVKSQPAGSFVFKKQKQSKESPFEFYFEQEFSLLEVPFAESISLLRVFYPC